MASRYYLSNFLVSLLMGFFLLFSIFFSYVYFAFNLVEISIIIVVCILLYYFVLFVLISTSKIADVPSKERTTHAKPIKRSENDIINAIVNEVYNKDEEEVVLPTYVGNSKTKMYHLADCKLAEKVSAKLRLENNSLEFFKKRKFKKCKLCLKE